MSEIKKAREIIELVIAQVDDVYIKRQLHNALALMHRVAPIRKARGVGQVISEGTRQRVKRLAKDNRLTMQQITNKMGLRNMRIVSHILHGKR